MLDQPVCGPLEVLVLGHAGDEVRGGRLGLPRLVLALLSLGFGCLPLLSLVLCSMIFVVWFLLGWCLLDLPLAYFLLDGGFFLFPVDFACLFLAFFILYLIFES